MKIQTLAIIFVLIIMPISVVLGEYSAMQRKIFAIEQTYDSSLITSTDDALKAFQINTFNDTTTGITDRKMNIIEASANAFFNSMEQCFSMQGYSKEDLHSYVPALVYTMYDGYYIYSPYQNITEQNGTINLGSTGKDYGFKPYVYYSCRYTSGANNDFVITYTLDNYITIQGFVKGAMVDKAGYLLTRANAKDKLGVFIDSATNQVYYNGVPIEKESNLTENLVESDGTTIKQYKYIKLNGTKYYLDEGQEKIFYILGGDRVEQAIKAKDEETYAMYKNAIENNISAIDYYKKAYEFTLWVDNNLSSITVNNAVPINNLQDKNIGNIFDGNYDSPGSNFNTHRKDVIRYAIESNLSIAIANFNNYSGSTTDFQMPVLKETDWDMLQNEISIISFLQGLNMGGKIYNGYTVVANAKTEEVINEGKIYIATSDGYYHKINDKHLLKNSDYMKTYTVKDGVLDLDFEIRTDGATNQKYRNRTELGCYTSIVEQSNVDSTCDSIYEYLTKHKNDIYENALIKYYTALGREKWGRRFNSLILTSLDEF